MRLNNIEIEVFVETKINKMVRGGDSKWHEFLSFAATDNKKLEAGFNNAQDFLKHLYIEYQGTLSHRYIIDGKVLCKQQIIKRGEESWNI